MLEATFITKSAIGAEVFANLWVPFSASTFRAVFCLAQLINMLFVTMITELAISLLKVLTVTSLLYFTLVYGLQQPP